MLRGKTKVNAQWLLYSIMHNSEGRHAGRGKRDNPHKALKRALKAAVWNLNLTMVGLDDRQEIAGSGAIVK
tara:strand:- start:1979 stop:2191 length:213 start_codon:yes stop_codon:yes gene_type:complete